MASLLWKSLKDAISGDTALYPATVFTVLASGFAAYLFIFKLFRSSKLFRFRGSYTAEFPQDLIIEILQWLPAKNLLRFRCISESLRDVIDSQEFSRWHLTKTASDNKTHIKIIVQQVAFYWYQHPPHFRNDPVRFHVFDIDDPFLVDPYSGDPTELDICEYAFKFNRDSHTTFAHCNGLILLEEDPFSLVVWNPTTRKYRKLPVLPREDPIDYYRPCICALAFGYDSSIDDYKVLAIKERRFWLTYSGVSSLYEKWILEFKSGYWRRIEFPDDLDGYENFFLNGAILFLNCSIGVIFAFDLAKETFSKVYLPDFSVIPVSDSSQTQERPTNLQVFEGCLCVTFHTKEQPMEFYARKKNDDGEFCWIKLFSITNEQLYDLGSYIFETGVILGYSKDGDNVFLISGDRGSLYSYGFKERSMKLIISGYGHNKKVLSCIESLVWIDVEEEEEESNSETGLVRRKRKKRKKATPIQV